MVTSGHLEGLDVVTMNFVHKKQSTLPNAHITFGYNQYPSSRCGDTRKKFSFTPPVTNFRKTFAPRSGLI
jgi:hypothetical protein